MIEPQALLLFLLALAGAAPCQTAPGQFTLPAGTPLPVQTLTHLPMKAGRPIRAELLYPVYIDNKLVLPKRTVVLGTVVSLTPDHSRRFNARLRADFTPFHTPVVEFHSIVSPQGYVIPITTSLATDGAPLYRIVPLPPVKGGILGQYFEFGKQYLRDSLAILTEPEKADRLKQYAYSQIPYHPERIATGTAWTVETAAPITLAPISAPPADRPAAALHAAPVKAIGNPSAEAPGAAPVWTIKAYLNQPLSSETSKPNQTITATVAEPILNPDGTVAIPEGSILSGSVQQTRPARRFARSGQLRFGFRQLTRPGEQIQTVRASLASADTTTGQQLALDSEGNAKPRPHDKILIPAILIGLALLPLDGDSNGAADAVGKNAVASNGLGLIGLIVGTAAQTPNLAAGLGFYSAAVSFYERFLAKGKPVAFPKDTRIVLQTIAPRNAILNPARTPTE